MKKAKVRMLMASVWIGLAVLIALVMWGVFEMYASISETVSFDREITAAKAALAGLFVVYAALLARFRIKGAGPRDLFLNVAVCIGVPGLIIALYMFCPGLTGSLALW